MVTRLRRNQQLREVWQDKLIITKAFDPNKETVSQRVLYEIPPEECRDLQRFYQTLQGYVPSDKQEAIIHEWNAIINCFTNLVNISGVIYNWLCTYESSIDVGDWIEYLVDNFYGQLEDTVFILVGYTDPNDESYSGLYEAIHATIFDFYHTSPFFNETIPRLLLNDTAFVAGIVVDQTDLPIIYENEIYVSQVDYIHGRLVLEYSLIDLHRQVDGLLESLIPSERGGDPNAFYDFGMLINRGGHHAR